MIRGVLGGGEKSVSIIYKPMPVREREFMGEIVAEISQSEVDKFLQLQRVTFIKVDGKRLEDLKAEDELMAWYLWKYLLVLTLRRQLLLSDKEQADGAETQTHAQQVLRTSAWDSLVEATDNNSKYIELYSKYSK